MKKHDQTPILAYAITIFLSAFLLFQVQPMLGKMILPWFGGAASVWTACMLFFQSLLLLGYLYTHWVMRLLSPPRQSFLHIALLLLCLFFLPISPSESLKPLGSENPTWLIFYLLGVTRASAMALAAHRIRVNAVAPGITDTAQPRQGMSEDEIHAAADQVPLGRIASASDIAPIVQFLASEGAAHVTGQTWHVNGGQYLA